MLDLLILGASTRAAASSARRAGFRPACLDLFADRDLRAIAATHRLAPEEYPDGFEHLAAELPPSPWIYTGALENAPDLVDRIARARPLWGNDASILRAVRDPFNVAEALGHAGLPCPRVRRDAGGLPRDGSWLVKPLDSAGGQGIAPWLGGEEASAGRPVYLQERVEGTSLAAIFVASRSATVLAGATRQWIGRPGAAFGYRGSLGPWPLAPEERLEVDAIGRALAASFGLVGIFGVDLVLRDGVPWPVEVNPRYTASVEVLELAWGRSLLKAHWAACDPSVGEPVDWVDPAQRPVRFVGKRVVFASETCRYPEDGWEPSAAGLYEIPELADRPDVGENFAPGQPVVTVFASAESLEACQERLELRVEEWEGRLEKVL